MYFNRNWKFFYGENEEAYFRGFDDSSWREINLPHDFSVEHPFTKEESSGTGYLPGGIGWYRKHFDMPVNSENKRVFITFNGVYNNSRVWINSNYLGKRPYGYSSFTHELTEFVKKSNNVVSVKVSRLQTADSRWYPGTGIYRDVKLDITGRYSLVSAGSIFAKTDVRGGKGIIAVDYKIDGGSALIKFTLKDRDGNIAAHTEDEGERGTALLAVDNPRLWSDDDPYLYSLISEVYDGDEISDRKETKVGIRTLRFDCNEGFFVNGISKKLKGVCVHHDSGALGAAFYKPVWKRRLENLRQAGCNAIRTSHNPPDPLLLDLCDEMGFYVMDEAFDEWEGFKNKWWQGHNVYPPKHYGYADDFHEWHEKDLADMVKRDRNHPCVIMWSIGNEIDYPNDPYGYAAFNKVTGNNDANKPEQERIYSEDKPDAKRLTAVAEELKSIVKKYDTTRPVTAALSFPEMCEFIGLTDVLDIAGYNYREKFYAEHRAKHPDRFIFGSENGHTEEQWNYVKNNADDCGQFLWTGIDYLGEAGGWPYRASGAGIADLAGFPKNHRFPLRKMLWTDEPVLEIYLNPADWKYVTSVSEKATGNIPVALVTNLDNPEITAGGKKYTVPDKAENHTYYFTVPAGKGDITASAWDKSGAIHTAVLPVHSGLAALRTNAYDNTDPERGIRLIQLEVFTEDEKEIPVTDEETEISFALDGGTLIGIENGDIADLTPYFSSSRKTVCGRLIAFIRTEPGNTVRIKMTAGKTEKTIEI